MAYKDRETKREAYRAWRRTPAGRANNGRYLARYRSRPEIKARALAVERQWRKTPAGKASSARSAWKAGLRRRYGLTADAWWALLIDQAGRCAVCADPMQDPYVDHEHVTGKVRGLVHRVCNFAVAAVENWGHLLEPAKRYLSIPS